MEVTLHRKVDKELASLPVAVQKHLFRLVYEIELSGPVRGNWPNYGKPSDNRHHCCLKKGRSTYVVVWSEDKQSITLEVLSMLERTKTLPTDKGLVTLTLHVPKALVPTIRSYAHALLKQGGQTVPWREPFNRQFSGQTVAAISLQSARTAQGLTQKQLAELVDIPQRHISEMENGKRNIGKERATRLAGVLDTDYRVFL